MSLSFSPSYFFCVICYVNCVFSLINVLVNLKMMTSRVMWLLAGYFRLRNLASWCRQRDIVISSWIVNLTYGWLWWECDPKIICVEMKCCFALRLWTSWRFSCWGQSSFTETDTLGSTFLQQVVEKSKEGEEEVRVAAVEAVLKEAHDLFLMFFGSIRGLLEKHPAGDVARSYLHAFFPDYLAGKICIFLSTNLSRVCTICLDWLHCFTLPSSIGGKCW